MLRAVKHPDDDVHTMENIKCPACGQRESVIYWQDNDWDGIACRKCEMVVFQPKDVDIVAEIKNQLDAIQQRLRDKIISAKTYPNIEVPF